MISHSLLGNKLLDSKGNTMIAHSLIDLLWVLATGIFFGAGWTTGAWLVTKVLR
jgi:hypothetical protein